jgi:predicted O-methyltransferase YrrM
VTELARETMHALYGRDIWTGFQPSRPAGKVVGWNGTLPILAQLAAEATPGIVIDVGVWKGMSTIFMAEAMKKAGHNGCVISVDTFLGSIEHWKGSGPNPIWEFDRQVGMPDLFERFTSNVWHANVANMVVPLPQTSALAARIIRGAKIQVGLVHIDAGHDYEDVAADIAAYWPLIARGGVLIGDDYPMTGVKRAAEEFAARVGRSLEVTNNTKWWLRKA